MSAPLVTTIEEAFRCAEYPGDFAIATPTYDDEGTTEHFCRTHWKDHSGDNLESFTSSITFFTPEAFAFYLPAFMIAALRNPSSGIGSSLVYRLCPPKADLHRPSFLAWWARLSGPQQGTVVAFLRELQERNESVPELAVLALEAYLAV